MKPAILVLCTGNSARSQMGEGLLRHYLGDRFEIHSAGTKPGVVRPEAVAVMAELGIDIAHHRSKHVNEFLDANFALAITVCDNARDACPFVPGVAKWLHWSFHDPAATQSEEMRLASFREIRDQIRVRVEELSSTI